MIAPAYGCNTATMKALNRPSFPHLRPRARQIALAIAGTMSVLSLLSVSPPPAAAETEPIRPIVFPIDSTAIEMLSWSDTFGAPRSGGRSHEGVDILGPKLLPLIAAADGEVSWLRHDAARGNNLDITDADGWTYHYVHINNDTPGTDDGLNPYEFAFAPGIEQGATVKAGQVVAYLGDSGNAENVAPQLHFEISRPDGTPINPTASVDAAAPSKLVADDLGPYESTTELVHDVLSTLRGARTASDDTELITSINSQGFVAAIEPLVGADSRAASIDRLYVSFFRRPPDYDGYRYWITRHGQGLELVEIADVFAASQEFETRYGNLSFGEYLDLLYHDVLGRAPDEAGKQYWLDRLEDPSDIVTRGTVVAFFAESLELRRLTNLRSEVVGLTALFEDRRPTDSEIEAWTQRRATESFAAVAKTHFDLG